MASRLAREWVLGWALSRGTAPPVEQAEGFRIDVGLPHHVARYVLLDADEAAVRKAAGSVTVPNTWLKAFAAPETIAPWLPPGWTAGPPTFLMATELSPSDVRAPDGYALTVEGRALYEALGWRVHAPLAGFVYEADLVGSS